MRNFVCFLVLVFGCALVNGGDSVDVLFVGNSYTSANSMVDILKGMVESVRDEGVDVGGLSDDRILPGGATFQRHWADPKKRVFKQIGHRFVDGKLKAVKRDFIVLQEQSQGALKPASRARMFKYARLICGAAKAKGAECVFYMTWARRSTFGEGVKGKMFKREFMYEVMRDGRSVIVDPKVMTVNEGIARTYRQIADELGAKVAPCGVAFEKAIKEGIVVHR